MCAAEVNMLYGHNTVCLPFVGSLKVFKGKGGGILLGQALTCIPGAAAEALQAPIPRKAIPGWHV